MSVVYFLVVATIIVAANGFPKPPDDHIRSSTSKRSANGGLGELAIDSAAAAVSYLNLYYSSVQGVSFIAE